MQASLKILLRKMRTMRIAVNSALSARETTMLVKSLECELVS